MTIGMIWENAQWNGERVNNWGDRYCCLLVFGGKDEYYSHYFAFMVQWEVLDRKRVQEIERHEKRFEMCNNQLKRFKEDNRK